VNDWEGNGRGLLQDYVSLKIYGLCAENRIWDLQNTTYECSLLYRDFR
jgi:hypothetical protein